MSRRAIQCELCPKLCIIEPGQSGECRIRVNLDGTLRAVTYGFPSAIHVDPIEKKPLFHFKPGTPIFSIATVGCNLHCLNCQNASLSQANPEEAEAHPLPPERLVELAVRRGCRAIAYTYSEPIVFYEYALDSSRLARERGLDNVLVTAGYGNLAPMRELFRSTQAANVDLKFFDDARYREVCQATLRPVLNTLVLAKEMGVWLEVTHLVIPTLNDDMGKIGELATWMVQNLGPDTPLHLSRFYPRHRLQNLPPTPEATLVQAAKVAQDAGIRFVYLGNVRGGPGERTVCPHDGTVLVRRRGYHVAENQLAKAGRCPTCHREIAGVWK